MARPRNVPAFDCSARVDILARRILATRVDDLEDQRATITGPEDVTGLHDLRIAGKRLRYTLETFDFCFPDADLDALADRVRVLQDVLGRIHDLDVLIELLKVRADKLDHRQKEEALAAIAQHPDSVRVNEAVQHVFQDVAHREQMTGIYQIIAGKIRERGELYLEFEKVWADWEGDNVLQQVRELA